MHQFIVDSVNRCYPLGYNTNPFFRCRGVYSPCLTNSTFLGDKFVNSIYIDKSGLGNDAVVRSNAIQLTGISTTTFSNSVMEYCDRVLITNSADNIAWSIDIDKDTIYTINKANRTFSIDSINHYYSTIELQTLDIDNNYVTFCKFLNSSNSNEEDNAANEDDWKDGIMPFDYFRDETWLLEDNYFI